MTQRELIAKTVLLIYNSRGQPVDEAVLTSFYAALEDLDDDRIRHGCRRFFREYTGGFLNSAAFRSLCLSGDYENEPVIAHKAWLTACRAMREFGTYRTVIFADVPTAYAIKAGLGGWIGWGASFQSDEWQRRAFMEAYNIHHAHGNGVLHGIFEDANREAAARLESPPYLALAGEFTDTKPLTDYILSVLPLNMRGMLTSGALSVSKNGENLYMQRTEPVQLQPA